VIEFGNDSFLIDEAAPFLVKAEENGENCLRLEVELSARAQAQLGAADTSNVILNKILSETVPILRSKERYEIIFENYIMYNVRNESYCSWDDYEIRDGKYFIVFKRSRLLDLLPQLTDCQLCEDGSAYPDRWLHYGIYCQNHIIDIISHNEPAIQKMVG